MQIATTNVTNPDFIQLNKYLDNFMLHHDAVDTEAYCPYFILEQGYKENISVAFVAYVDGMPAGCAAYRQKESGVAELKRVFVYQEYRKQGVAKALLDAVFKNAKSNGFHSITLSTLLSLKSAVQLYKTTGFNELSREGLAIYMKKGL